MADETPKGASTSDAGGSEEFDIESPEPPQLSEKSNTRKLLALWMTYLVIFLFACLSLRYIWLDCRDDERDFVHLLEILLVMYGTILGFYFGTEG